MIHCSFQSVLPTFAVHILPSRIISYTFAWGWAIRSDPITSQEVLRQDNGRNLSPSIFTELQQKVFLTITCNDQYLCGIPLLKPHWTVIVSYLTSSHKNSFEYPEQQFSGCLSVGGMHYCRASCLPCSWRYLYATWQYAPSAQPHSRITIELLIWFSIMHTIAYIIL